MLRLGHRPARDKRVTTHVALTARAFGAEVLYLTTKDSSLEARVEDVVRRFGGAFQIVSGVSRRRIMKEWEGRVVHLTMYGLPLDDVLADVPRDDLLVVVGAEKVPREVFETADFNVAVGNQPHSEVAALAVFLDRLLEGGGIRTAFKGPVRILPSARGKVVEGPDGETGA